MGTIIPSPIRPYFKDNKSGSANTLNKGFYIEEWCPFINLPILVYP